MSSKNPGLVGVWGLVLLGLSVTTTMAQPSVQERIDEDGVRLGFDAAPNSSLPEGSEATAGSYYGVVGERQPAGAPPTENDSRYFNTQEASLIGAAPSRYQDVSARPDDSQRAEQSGLALGRADGESLHPGSDTTTFGTVRTSTQKPAEVAANTGAAAEAPSADKIDNTEPSGKSKLTMWITMGLFASLAGNLFFAWVAWDTHAKYQDLVDDMGEKDGLQRPQDRPTRGDKSTAKNERDAIAAVGSRGQEA